MTLRFKVEEKMEEEDDTQESSLAKAGKSWAALELLLMCMNWEQIFYFSDVTRQDMAAALLNQKIDANKVKGVGEMSKVPIQCASCNTVVTFTDDDLLLGLITSSWMEGQSSSLCPRL